MTMTHDTVPKAEERQVDKKVKKKKVFLSEQAYSCDATSVVACLLSAYFTKLVWIHLAYKKKIE